MTGTALQRVPTMATFLQTTLFQRSRPVFNICRLSAHSRNFVTDHPRPEPVVETFAGPSKYRRNGSAKKHLRGHSSLSQPSHSTPTSSKTSVETFSDPARPQPYYAKHPPFRDLPRPKVWPHTFSVMVISSHRFSTEKMAICASRSCRWSCRMGRIPPIYNKSGNGL